MRALLVVSALGLTSCRPAAPTTPPPAEGSEEEDQVRFEMSEHFMDVSAIKDAMVDGELDTIHELAEGLATREDPREHPEDWRPHVEAVIAHADALTKAQTLEAAAAEVARLGGACGACHQALDVHPPFDDAVEPAADGTALARMQRHEWATDRMWEGIVGPSDWAWTNGAQRFGDAPGCGTDGDPEICRTLEALGPRVVEASDTPSRIAVYGELLGTCAACHAPTLP